MLSWPWIDENSEFCCNYWFGEGAILSSVEMIDRISVSCISERSPSMALSSDQSLRTCLFLLVAILLIKVSTEGCIWSLRHSSRILSSRFFYALSRMRRVVSCGLCESSELRRKFSRFIIMNSIDLLN